MRTSTVAQVVTSPARNYATLLQHQEIKAGQRWEGHRTMLRTRRLGGCRPLMPDKSFVNQMSTTKAKSLAL